MKHDDLLIEIGCEELPARELPHLAQTFAEHCHQWLEKANIAHGTRRWFATPRRLAVFIDRVAAHQPDQVVTRRGPAIKQAFDEHGNPSAAAMGFARSCGVDVKTLKTEETKKGAWLSYAEEKKGAALLSLLPTLLSDTLPNLPMPNPMRWGAHAQTFLRPVHWLLMLYGDQTIPARAFDLTAGNMTYGHRFHHPAAITIQRPHDYVHMLAEQGFVQADFNARQKSIKQQIEEIARDLNGIAVIEKELLEEVTGLVEWPVALCGELPVEFLQLPPEVLITALRTHQKSFVIKDTHGGILPYFVTVSNLQSNHPEQVILGNQRVVNARLNDAMFFYQSDQRVSLEQCLPRLQTITFQTKLGSLHNKTERMEQLASYIASHLNANAEYATRAALLAKCDLVSDMVGEFPELQGIMGYYYARKQQEPADIALAIKEHYYPRFAGDELPQTVVASSVALADKIDSLIGLFGINKKPSGTHDPFGLRRAASGVMRIAIEKKLSLDLQAVLEMAASLYGELSNTQVVSDVLHFIYDRIRAWYADQAIAVEIIQSVLARKPTILADIEHRIHAVIAFQKLPEANALAAAHKRVHNILRQAEYTNHHDINQTLLQQPAEIALATQLMQQKTRAASLYQQGDYTAMLQTLASLRPAVDTFFDEVMVLVEDDTLRKNRLALLQQLQHLFGQVADISYLAGQLK